MKPAGVILLSLAGVVGLAWLFKGTAAGRLVFFPDETKTRIEFDPMPVITLGIIVQNTSGEKFVIRSMAGNLFANKYLIGNISSFSEITVNPNSEQIIYVKSRLSPIGIVNDIIRAIQFKNFSQELEIDSYANIDNQQVKINLKFKVGA